VRWRWRWCTCLVRGAVFKSNGVAHQVAQLGAHFLGDTLGDGHGGHTTRLRAPDAAPLGEAIFVEVLRELRRLARTRLSHDHDHVVLPDDAHQLLADLPTHEWGEKDRVVCVRVRVCGT
jgi:hypothetical protein